MTSRSRSVKTSGGTSASECAERMTVQMDTSSPGPYRGFQSFMPMPQADNLVTLEVPCNDQESAYGYVAQRSGDWKYWLRAKPVGSTNFPDESIPASKSTSRISGTCSITYWRSLVGSSLAP